jgi:hypothetical protein
MKTNRIALTLAAAAVATAFQLNLGAAEPFLSPRAKANQIRTVPGVTEDKLDRANLFKRRGDLVFHPTVKGKGDGRDLVREGRNIAVSPRAAETFPHLRMSRRGTLSGGLAAR